MFTQYPTCENRCENPVYLKGIKIEELLNKEITCRECDSIIKFDSAPLMKWAIENYTDSSSYGSGRLEELESQVEKLTELVTVLFNERESKS